MVQSDTAYKRLSIDSSFVRVPYVVEKKKRLTVISCRKGCKKVDGDERGKHLILQEKQLFFRRMMQLLLKMNSWKKNI